MPRLPDLQGVGRRLIGFDSPVVLGAVVAGNGRDSAITVLSSLLAGTALPILSAALFCRRETLPSDEIGVDTLVPFVYVDREPGTRRAA